MEATRYLEKLYGGLLGKCIGVRLGAPVEPTIWTYERIRDTYGEITDYVKRYKNFAADDDVNGPLFFIRALIDGADTNALARGPRAADGVERSLAPVTPASISRAWLNYAREGVGFFWWGGYGRSTEHTAYLNLKSGLSAPDSGCTRVNGSTIAEQIGGQIFIDSWGWVYPEKPEEAAEAAGIAASVSHDGNGIYGANFIAACISRAFSYDGFDGSAGPESASAVRSIVEEALTLIPAESEYARVVTAMREFYTANPDDWRAARDYLGANFGYDRYPGVCHIIPNAGVCALALYYGEGSFARSIEIATMCGWDTDCNAGNVGAIMGVLSGPEGIPDHYRRPVNDFHVTSSIAGALNIISLPTAARELAILGSRLTGIQIPEGWHKGSFTDDIFLDFSLPGSTAGIRSSSDFLAPVAPGRDLWEKGRTLGIGDGAVGDGSPAALADREDEAGGVVILLDRLVRGETARVFYKPYYTRDDFDDERYKPTFSPTAYPGQHLVIRGVVHRMSGRRIAVAPYARDARTGELFQDGFSFPDADTPFEIDWTLPEVPFAIGEAGVIAMNPDAEKFLGKLVLREYRIFGRRAFAVSFSDEREEFAGLSRCSLVGGAWELDGEALHVVTRDRFQLYSGPYYSTDGSVEADLIPEYGDSHLVAIRARGAEYGYYFGLAGGGKAVLIRRDGADETIAEAPFSWSFGERYRIAVSARTLEGAGCSLAGTINGADVLRFTDSRPHPYGMAGLVKISGGRTRFFSLSAREE